MKEKKNMKNTKGTMTIETFTGMIRDALAPHLNDCSIEAQEVKKNNGVVLHGLRIMEQESAIGPVIYLDNAFEDYQNGRDFQEIVAAVAEEYRNNCPISGFDTAFITDYESLKEKICLKVINTDLNRELLADVPHVPFCDLSIVFYVPVDSFPGNASIMINNRFMAIWGVDTDELFETAKANTQRILGGKVVPMRDIIASIPNSMTEVRLPGPEDCGMYVATNREKVNGASVFLYDSLLSGFADKIGKDFYIIPSSIHELIFLSDSINMEPEDIREMISEVNSTCVDPEEVLSDNVYRYRRATRQVEIA